MPRLQSLLCLLLPLSRYVLTSYQSYWGTILSVYLSIFLSAKSISLFYHLSTNLSMHPSIHLCVFISVPIHIFILSICVSMYGIHVSLDLKIHLCKHPCMSISLLPSDLSSIYIRRSAYLFLYIPRHHILQWGNFILASNM